MSHLLTTRSQKKQNRFGSYNLLQTLGEGEFGKVKLGVHVETGQEVAIKLIKKDSGSENYISKIEREISVLKTLNHPYIVKLLDVVETEKYIGIILEYASGGELFEYILAHRYLKEKDAKRFFAQLISSVHYMHKRKIVHRDLKLENILLDKNRNIVVTDFGFANQFASAADDLMATTCGSPCYAAPELVVNAGLYAGSAVDVWSCGVILYAMLCGFLPFDDDPSNPDSDNINQLYRYILSTHLMFPSYVGAEPRDLLEKMLVPDPAKRCSLDYVIKHPWLDKYRSFLEKDAVQIEADGTLTNASDVKSSLMISSSISTSLPIKRTVTTTRKTHIPMIKRDHFAPVMNEKYLVQSEEPMKSNALKYFSIGRSNATANVIHASSKVPQFISRKAVKNDSAITVTSTESVDIDTFVNPERSLSSPSVVESKFSTFGSVRKSQRRGTEKLLSFFAGKPAQLPLNTSSTPEKIEKENKQDDEEEGDGDDNEPINPAANSTFMKKAQKSLVRQESKTTQDSSSHLDDCSIEQMMPPKKEARTELTLSTKEPIQNSSSMNQDEKPIEQHSIISAISNHNTALVTSSVVSCKGVSKSEQEGTAHLDVSNGSESSIVSDSIANTSFSSASIPASPAPPAPMGPSASVRLGDSGRKAMAAVRRSIYRKHRSQPPQEVHVSFPKSRFEETDAPQELYRPQRNTWSASPSEMKEPTAPKKTGQKMMDWIKKKSHVKEAKKETVTPNLSSQLLNKSKKINLSTHHRNRTVHVQETIDPVAKPKEILVIKNSSKDIKSILSSTANTVKVNDTVRFKTQYQQEPVKEIIHVPEQGTIGRRNPLSGSESALVDLSKQEIKQSMDDRLQFHQGAIDRTALTSKSPLIVMQDISRILRILGIDTRVENDFIIKCTRRKAKSHKTADNSSEQITTDTSSDSSLEVVRTQGTEPIYGDGSIDTGEEIRFAVEMCRIKNLPGIYIVDVRRIKGNAWTYKFLYHKLIDFLDLAKDGYIQNE